jgi:hypothetical protein
MAEAGKNSPLKVLYAERFTIDFFAVGDKEPAREVFALIAYAFFQDLPEVCGQEMMRERKGARRNDERTQNRSEAGFVNPYENYHIPQSFAKRTRP